MVRASIAERYPSKEQYLALAQAQCERLVTGGYLLTADVPQVMKRIESEWPAENRAAAHDSTAAN